ncbi:MAG: aldo/keto reductase, partial [Kangiellaceae bacterium]|nr:aldo/keto reductase [Kangiellaceae bacterium]
VDTAAVYGDAEQILGEFLQARRDKWIVASKFSGQEQGMQTTLEEQLRRLKTDYLDFYQIHWTPSEPALYDELYKLKASGKVRYVGVSLSSVNEIDYVISKTKIDGFQIPFSLLDPLPMIKRLDAIQRNHLGVIVRSCLHNGFLAGKYSAASRFDDEDDQRSQYSTEKIQGLVNKGEEFKFLINDNRSLVQTAISYVLSFPQTSSVILSTKNQTQAQENFAPTKELDETELAQISKIQKSMGIDDYSLSQKMHHWLSFIKQTLKR